MKLLVLLVAFLVMVIGIVGLVSPAHLMMPVRYATTPIGLYAISAFRVGMGVVLMLVAPTSRAPRTLRVVGAVVLVAGLITPFIGVDRVRHIADWETAQGPGLMRAVAGLILAIGSLGAWAVGTGRRPA